MPFALPVAESQIWLFWALSLVFFAFVLRAISRRERESGGRSDPRSRFGIILQSIGIGLAGIGPFKPTLPWLSFGGIAGDLGVLLLMGGAIAVFASSSTALGKNWSLEARTRSDHQLVRTGPYAVVRHPIYLGMTTSLSSRSISSPRPRISSASSPLSAIMTV